MFILYNHPGWGVNPPTLPVWANEAGSPLALHLHLAHERFCRRSGEAVYTGSATPAELTTTMLDLAQSTGSSG